jgi:hypothetical protein
MTNSNAAPENPETAAPISLAAASMVDEPTDKPTTRILWLYGLADASGVPHPVMACAVAIVRLSYPQVPRRLDTDKLAAATGYAARTVRGVIAGLKRNGWLKVDWPGWPAYFVTYYEKGGPVRFQVSPPDPATYCLHIGSPVWIGRS